MNSDWTQWSSINLLNGQLTIGNNGNQQKTISTNVLKILTKIP